MKLSETIKMVHDRAAEAGPVGRLLFGARLPLLYPLILLLLLLYLLLDGGTASRPEVSTPAVVPAPPTEVVEVMPRVPDAPPMPAPIDTPPPPGPAVETPAPVVPAATAEPAGSNGNADWLLSLPPEGYTLQLLGSRHEKTLRAFVRRHGLESMTAYYRTRHKGGGWYVLLYGLYTDRDEASVAVGTLPPAVRNNAPFPRTIQSVQKAIRAGR